VRAVLPLGGGHGPLEPGARASDAAAGGARVQGPAAEREEQG
jgi:hypothetical protein